MKAPPLYSKKATLAAVAAVLMALAVLPGCKKAASPTVASAKSAPGTLAGNPKGVAGTHTNLPTDFVSVFDDSPPPGNKGRDPFNPDSTVRNPAPPVETRTAAGAVPADAQLKLFSVAGSPGHRVVDINNKMFDTFDPPMSVKIPGGGTVMLKVLEIGQDYADVTIAGVAGKKRLTLGQKKPIERP